MSTQTDTANADLSTWAGVDIGTPHPNRLVVLSIYRGIGNVAADTTVNGISPFLEQNNSSASAQGGIHVFRVPLGLTADLWVSVVGSQRKAVGVTILYPKSPRFLLSKSNDQQTTTTDATGTVPTMAGGTVFYAGTSNGTLTAFGTTSSGADAVIEDVDAQLEATGSYTFGHINVTIGGDITLTLAETVSSTKQLSTLSLGIAP
jgi:hypothetical protein